jgi:tRNA (guanine-N7-)-methyltransferase
MLPARTIILQFGKTLVLQSQVSGNLGAIKRIRLRHHVNPLSKRYLVPTPAPNWAEVYEHWGGWLGVDIGCGRGEYLLKMAQQYPERNFLGLEIRQPLVIEANGVRERLGLRNLYYLFCNVNVSLAGLFSDRCIHQVSIQFPDPWFKRRQRKRRMVTPELVHQLSKVLVAEAVVLLQSDVQWVWEEMQSCFLAHPQFRLLPEYPPHVPTERETWAIKQGLTVYRSALTYVL